MNKINKNIDKYKSEECPCCNDGQVEIKTITFVRLNGEIVGEESHIEDCFYCGGKGFLYIKEK